MNFVDDTICDFEKETRNYYTQLVIWRKKKAFTIQLSYLHANEKWFIKEIEDFTNSRVKLVKICNTPKIQSVFN